MGKGKVLNFSAYSIRVINNQIKFVKLPDNFKEERQAQAQTEFEKLNKPGLLEYVCKHCNKVYLCVSRLITCPNCGHNYNPWATRRYGSRSENRFFGGDDLWEGFWNK